MKQDLVARTGRREATGLDVDAVDARPGLVGDGDDARGGLASAVLELETDVLYRAHSCRLNAVELLDRLSAALSGIRSTRTVKSAKWRRPYASSTEARRS